MAFEKLVRFELDGIATYGDLVENTDDGFKVTKLKGSLEDGFSADGDRTITVSKACDTYILHKSVLGLNLTT